MRKLDKFLAAGVFNSRSLMLSGVMMLLGTSAMAQADTTTATIAVPKPAEAAVKKAGSVPFIHDVNGVMIGMTASEVKKKVGKPDQEDPTGMLLSPGGANMQIRLDADKKVSSVAVIYSGSSAKAPEYAEVFGPDLPVEKGDDGRIYNIVRYPEAGYWVAYSRTMFKDKPITTITITKMP